MYIVTSYTAQDRQLHVEQFRTWLSPNLLLHGYTHAYIMHTYRQSVSSRLVEGMRVS